MSAVGGPADVLGEVLAADPPPFAILHRPQVCGPGVLDVLVGDVERVERLADVPDPGEAGGEVLALLPYRQITERGLAAVDDGEPLVVMRVARRATVSLSEAFDRLPEVATALTGGRFDPPDEDYAASVAQVIAEEIGRGEGSNFVLRRSFRADIPDYTVASSLTLFRRLLRGETGAYWTFVVHTGDRTLVGASPELHVTLDDGVATMNPISGTYRYPTSGPSLDDLMGFLADRKEAAELTMVVDEELKMMARFCDGGARATGPFLREMASLAHTEYLLHGRSTLDPRDILRETLFAPTVTGSPLESACRMIRRYEDRGRGYYAGAVALIGRDAHGRDRMDSAILIRTADIDADGHVEIGVGSTIVRDSAPESEVAETRAKAATVLRAFEGGPRPRFGEHPLVRAALLERNRHLAGFWLDRDRRAHTDPDLVGRRVVVVDAQDTFTAMLGHQLRSLGLSAKVVGHDRPVVPTEHDLVVLGPGPGDPADESDPRIAALGRIADAALAAGVPVLAVCLSHQVLSRRLGLPVERLVPPNQGVARTIDLFGTERRVGFYNTFAARWHDDVVHHPVAGPVEVGRDPVTGEVFALRGQRLATMQFHPESVLTHDGLAVLRDALRPLLARRTLVGVDGSTEPARRGQT